MNNRAVFFDLQGTLGGDMFGHVLDFEFFPDAVQAIQIINSLPLKTIIITNQSRVAKDDLTLAQFNEKMTSLIHQLAQQNAQIDAVYCCPHQKADQCKCKKPKIGMALQAKNEHQLDLTSSYVVGDTGKSDMLNTYPSFLSLTASSLENPFHNHARFLLLPAQAQHYNY